NNSLDNDADHILAWANGGATGISNLGQPCRKHHRLRHTTGWEPTPATKDEPPGWTSPTGRHYTSEHQDWEPPWWPDGLLLGNVDFLRTPPAPWEDALERLLHAHA
ncbi:HNH endonuclease signature motif containing protein, partial [Arthrobacter sp. C152]